MGLLDNISSISNNVNGNLGRLSGKIKDISTAAKAILCLPAMISGFINNIPGIINGIIAGVGSAITNTINGTLNQLLNGVNGIAGQAIQDAVNKVNRFAGLIGAIIGGASSIFGSLLGFVNSIRAEVDDIKNFVSSSANCNYAGASLAKCIAQQTLSNLSKKDIKSAASGRVSIQTLTSRASRAQNPLGLVKKHADKHVSQLNRASNIINKAGRFI